MNTLIDVMLEDHKELKDILAQMKAASNKDPTVREVLFHNLERTLATHTYEEEQFLYHAVEKNRKVRPDTLEGFEEHRLINRLLLEMKPLQAQNEKWQAKFEVIRELLIHHLDEEEKELFPGVEKEFRSEDLERLGQDLLKSRKKNVA